MLCNYGCEQEAKYETSNGKQCCSRHHNSCPAVKKKNSDGMKDAYSSGRKALVFTDEHRQRSIRLKKQEAAKSLDSGEYQGSNASIRNILKESFGLKEECSGCGLTTWQEQLLPLELDHIDGNSTNNRIDNLRLLCPNCHAITPTWRGRNINKGERKVTDNNLISALKKEKNIRQALLSVGLAAKGGNYARAERLMRGWPNR